MLYLWYYGTHMVPLRYSDDIIASSVYSYGMFMVLLYYYGILMVLWCHHCTLVVCAWYCCIITVFLWYYGAIIVLYVIGPRGGEGPGGQRQTLCLLLYRGQEAVSWLAAHRLLN